jgi:hypothetical protein
MLFKNADVTIMLAQPGTPVPTTSARYNDQVAMPRDKIIQAPQRTPTNKTGREE